jgi:hypothetical protein
VLAVRRGTRFFDYYRRFGSWRGEGVEALIGDFGGVGMVLKSALRSNRTDATHSYSEPV